MALTFWPICLQYPRPQSVWMNLQIKKKPLQNILEIPPVRKIRHEKRQGPLPSSEHHNLKKNIHLELNFRVYKHVKIEKTD